MSKLVSFQFVVFAFIILEGINIAIWYFKQKSLRFILYAALAFLSAIALAAYLVTGA